MTVIDELTKDFNGDEIPFALADLVDCDTRDVGFGLECDGVDGPVEALDVIDNVSASHPDELVGLRTAGVVHVAGQRDGVALHNLLEVLDDEGLAGRV